MQFMPFLCSLLLLSQQAIATDYFVSNNGNDSNKGTQEKPWQSIAKVNTTIFNAGDRIFFQSGQTFYGNLILHEQSRPTLDQPITIASSGNGKAIIVAGNKDGILIKNKSGIIIRNLVVKGDDLNSNQGYGIKIINEKPGNKILHFVRIENVEASCFRWAGIYVGGIPTDLPGVEAPEGSRYGYRNVLIEKCTAFDNMYYGIYVSAAWRSTFKDYGNADVTIRDCVTYANTGDPAYTKNHSGSGIMLDDTNKGLIEYCTSYKNGALNAGKTGGPCAIWTHASNQVIIQYCEAYANRTNGAADGGGFDMDGGVTNSVIQYCYSHDNDGSGYLIWNYEGAPHQLRDNVIRYCISENDGRKHTYGAIHIGTGGLPVQNIDVYHNSIYITSTPNGKPKGIWTGAWGSKESNRNLRFFNNLIVTQGDVPLIDIESANEEVVFEGNAYWNLDKNFLVNYKGTSYTSLELWQQASGQEKAGEKEQSLFNEPYFVKAGKNETINNARNLAALKSFVLQKDSPLSHAGLDLAIFGISPATKDFWGTSIPANQHVSIGAYQVRE
jgi:hypothetical protein